MNNPHDDFAERRKEPRFPSSSYNRIISPAGEEIRVQVMDVSRSGLCIRLGKVLCPGDRIEVRLGTLVVFAEVRYFVPVSQGAFDAGVFIEDVKGESQFEAVKAAAMRSE